MKRQILMVLMIAVSFIALCSGCGSGNQSSAKSSDVTPKELEMYYPGDIMKVDSIEIFDGSNGNRKTITDQVRIREWIEKVRHLRMVPDPDQKDSAGVLFRVTLFEKGEKKLTFTPTQVDNKPIEPNSALADLMKELYGS